MGKSNIEWTDMVWNPVTGCTKVSEGCANCYAERMAMRFTGHFNVTCHPDRLDQPLRWKKPRRIFVCSMGDLFHEDVPSIVPGNYSFIDQVFGIMALCTQHNFLILTKRPERMADYCNQWEEGMGRTVPIPDGQSNDFLQPWPLPNLWLGVTAENQKQADKHIPILLQIPAAKRFVSIEPMLGTVCLQDIWNHDYLNGIKVEPEHLPTCDPNRGCDPQCPEPVQVQTDKLDWVIVGAESGPRARWCNRDYMIRVVNQCKSADVPVFVKQIHIAGTKLSKNIDEWPEDLRVREYPT